jgi:hypothetical protein
LGLFQAREASSGLRQIEAIHKIIRLSREAKSLCNKTNNPNECNI